MREYMAAPSLAILGQYLLMMPSRDYCSVLPIHIPIEHGVFRSPDTLATWRGQKEGEMQHRWDLGSAQLSAWRMRAMGGRALASIHVDVFVVHIQLRHGVGVVQFLCSLPQQAEERDKASPVPLCRLEILLPRRLRGPRHASG